MNKIRANALSGLKRMSEQQLNFLVGGTSNGSGSTRGHSCFCCDNTTTKPPIIIIVKSGYEGMVIVNDDNSVTLSDGTTGYPFTIDDLNEIYINADLAEYVDVTFG